MNATDQSQENGIVVWFREADKMHCTVELVYIAPTRDVCTLKYIVLITDYQPGDSRSLGVDCKV